MSSFTKTPCKECGKLTLSQSGNNDPVFCNEFCKARNQVLSRRNQTPIKVTRNRTSVVRRGGCCGG